MTFALKKIITSLILPPGIFILVLLTCATSLIARKHRRVGLMHLAIAVSLWILSAGPVPRLLMVGLESDYYTFPSRPTGDVIVLLGGGVVDQAPDFSGRGVPSAMMMGRVVTAVRLYRSLQLPIIVTGGTAPGSDRQSESAAVVKRILVDLGVAENQIIEEDQALDTMENARYTAAICDRKGYSQPILVTSAYHLRRSVAAFTRTNLHPTPFPAYFLVEQTEPLTWMQLLPDAGSLDLSARAIREYLGLLYYKLF